MIWLFAGGLAPAFIVSCLAARLIRRHAARFGLVDRPDPRKQHPAPIPLGGGIAIWLGVLLPFAAGQAALVWALRADPAGTAAGWADSLRQFAAPHLPGLAQQSGKLWLLLAAGTVLMLLGLADDRRGLSWKLRLAVQFAVAVVMVSAGWRMTLFIDLPWLTAAISVLWIVTLINTFNMLDNMDGLSAGVAAIAAGMLVAVIFLAPASVAGGPQLFVAGFFLVLIGSLLGFLVHNRPPARLFMGDAGSYFVGFCMACGTISTTYAGEGLPRHAILAPLCVLAIPLYDTFSVLAIRLWQGRSPFAADRSHVSHRLVELGLSKGRAVSAIYGLTLTCGFGALWLHRVDLAGAAAVLAVVLASLAVLAVVEAAARRGNRSRKQGEHG